MDEDVFDEWPDYKRAIYKDELDVLKRLGAKVFLNDKGNVEYIRFSGHKYCDSTIPEMVRIARLEVKIVDLRDTRITPQGVERLRHALPTTLIDF
jgi:hypothetical protein